MVHQSGIRASMTMIDHSPCLLGSANALPFMVLQEKTRTVCFLLPSNILPIKLSLYLTCDVSRLLRTVSKIENRTQEVIQEALSRPANTSTAPSPTHRNRTSIEIGDNGQGHHSNQSPSPAPEDMVLNGEL